MTRKPRAIGEVVGANIRMYRAKLSLTQSQLAEKIGIEPMSLSRIERGVAAPSLERLDLIARSLKVLPSDLLHELAGSAAPKEQALVRLLHRLKPEDAVPLLEIARRLARRH